VHNFLNGTIVYEYKEFEKAVTNIAMNQQQHLLIASSLDGLIKIFNIQTHELIQQLTTSTSQSIISMIYKNNLVIIIFNFILILFVYSRSIVEWKVVQLKYYNVMLIKSTDVK
jgi:WD40 repeat protein